MSMVILDQNKSSSSNATYYFPVLSTPSMHVYTYELFYQEIGSIQYFITILS